MININDLVSIRQAAAILGLTTKRVYELIHTDQLKSTIVAGKFCVILDDVEEFKKYKDSKKKEGKHE